MTRLSGFFAPRKVLSQPAVWAFASQGLTSAGNFICTVIMVQALGLGEFGRFSVAFLLLMITRNFLIAVILTSMSALGPKLAPRSQRPYRGFLLANAAAFSLVTSLLLYAGALAAGSLAGMGWLADIAAAMALANFAANLGDFYQRALFVANRGPSAAFVDVIRFGLQIALLLFATTGAAWSLDVPTALYILAGSSAAGCLFGAVLYGKIGWHRTFFWLVWRRHANMIRWLLAGNVFATILGPGLLLFAGIYLNDQTLGALRAMQNASNVLMLPVTAMQRISTNVAADRYHHGGLTALRRYVDHLILLIGGISTLLAVAMVFSSQIVVRTMTGISDGQMSWFLILFCVANIFSGLHLAVQTGLQSMEETKVFTTSNALGAAVAVLIIAGFVGIFGAMTVPVSRVVSLGVVFLFTLASWVKCLKADRRAIGG